MSKPVVIRRLHTGEQMASVVNLQREIWGYGEPGADYPYPARALLAFSESGGLILGAYADECLVGVAVAWLGRRRPATECYLHSQLMGILENYRHLGIGFQLKLQQRDFALEQGLSLVRWTFDPLFSRNASLNLRKLGALAQSYTQDCYGQIRSRFQGGVQTDRLWADWYLESPRVEGRLRSPQVVDYSAVSRITVCRTIVTDNCRFREPVRFLPQLADVELLAEIPLNFDLLLGRAPDLAIRWRLYLREVMTTYLSRNYTVDDLWLTGEAAFYHLSRKGLEILLKDPLGDS